MADKVTVMIAVNGVPHQVGREQFRKWLLGNKEVDISAANDPDVLEGEQDV